MLVVDCCGGILDGAGYKVEGMYDSVLGSDLWLGEVVVEYLDGVVDDDLFGYGVDNLEAAVVLECRADDETFAAVEVPRPAVAWFVVDDEWAAEGS